MGMWNQGLAAPSLGVPPHTQPVSTLSTTDIPKPLLLRPTSQRWFPFVLEILGVNTCLLALIGQEA